MKIRISKGVSQFAERAKSIWGLEEWQGLSDPDKDVLFFGLYFQEDYDAYDSFEGNRNVFWCGSDILRTAQIKKWLNIVQKHKANHYCETNIEADSLRKMGIEPEVVPSFLDNVNNFPVSFVPTNNPHIFLCGHSGREEEYGFNLVRRIAKRVPDATFHLYGIDKSRNFFYKNETPLIDKLAEVDSEIPNIWHHGKVPEGEFNNQITQYHCGLRTNEHDGFSEVIAKSVLLGQYPISKIPYDNIWNYNTEDELVALIEKIKFMKTPNYEARNYYLKRFNNFPFCKRNYWNPDNI